MSPCGTWRGATSPRGHAMHVLTSTHATASPPPAHRRSLGPNNSRRRLCHCPRASGRPQAPLRWFPSDAWQLRTPRTPTTRRKRRLRSGRRVDDGRSLPWPNVRVSPSPRLKHGVHHSLRRSRRSTSPFPQPLLRPSSAAAFSSLQPRLHALKTCAAPRRATDVSERRAVGRCCAMGRPKLTSLPVSAMKPSNGWPMGAPLAVPHSS